MSNLKTKIKEKRHKSLGSDTFKNEEGGIDLASIMVGVIVIGMIGGVIAATVFSVIPWTQDNAAKQQLDSITSAENAYMGLASSGATLPTGAKTNSYASSADLQSANLLATGPSYCVVPSTDGKSWTSFSQSKTGKVWSATNANTQPVIYTGILPTDCSFITESLGGPYVDPTPQLTTLTFNCDTTTTGNFPISSNVTGKEEWSDGVTNTYTGASNPTSRTLTAGVTYTASFTGTYTNFSNWGSLRTCLTAVNHWGANTGVTGADSAFFQNSKLTDVPAHIPTTIKNMNGMFNQATNFNDPDITKWDTSNVTVMSNMFNMTNAFNQPIGNWNTSKVTAMNGMFAEAKAFNQNINNWNTSNVVNIYALFSGATSYNQPLDKWDVSKVTDFYGIFRVASSFNQPLNSWNTVSATRMNATFSGATKFDQPLNNWKTDKVTDMAWMFSGTPYNQDISNWNTSMAQDMSNMFASSTFNKPLNSWNTSSVTNMNAMFSNNTTFNQPLNNWKTLNVTNMSFMFSSSKYNQDISSWDTGKVTTMNSMFRDDTNFVQNISGWNTVSLTDGNMFAYSYYFPASYKPVGTTLY